MMEKVDVNGDERHPLYSELTQVPDAEGNAGDVVWNFEKFLVTPDGNVTRFRPMVTPDDESLVSAVEAALPS
jgi:glutathione peroxidase